jgi:hypothetical protein
LTGDVVACCQHASPNGKRDILQLRTLELLHRCVERITVDVDDVLCEIPSSIKFCDESVGISQVAREVLLIEVSLASQDLLYLLGENFISYLLPVEEFGSLRGIVDDF